MNVMDNEDTNKSIPSQSKTRLKGERMPQRCRRCRNHNLIINLSGHKRYCKYRNCCCDQCVRTLTTQKWSAKKTYRNRALKQDKEKQDKEKQDKDKEKQDKEKQDKEKQDKEKQRKVSMNPDEPDEQVAPLPYEDALKAAEREREESNFEILIKHSLCEMKKKDLRLADSLMALVTTIVKYSQKNVTEANITEALHRISRVSIIHHAKIIHRIIEQNVILFLVNLFPP